MPRPAVPEGIVVENGASTMNEASVEEYHISLRRFDSDFGQLIAFEEFIEGVVVTPTLPRSRVTIGIRPKVTFLQNRSLLRTDLDSKAAIPFAHILQSDPGRHTTGQMVGVLMATLL